MFISRRMAMTLSLFLGLSIASTACGSGNSGNVEGKVNVVTTIYPLYYFAEQIGGEQAHVTNMIAAGVEPHDWTPKSRDLSDASNAQLFIYNGAGLESWLNDFMPVIESGGDVRTVEASHGIALIDGEGEEEGHEHGEEEEEGHSHEHEGDVDPHTWISPRSALAMAANIKDAYIAVDPAHRADYETRYEQLNERLKQLDAKFTDGLSPYAGRDIVVSHQAFGYLCRDYGLNQIAIMGLSPEAEPRAQDLLEISDYVKSHGIKTIFFEELVSDRLAKTLANEANIDTMVLNPLEGLTPEQEKAGDNYFSIMERNLENLQKALR
ncbi:metal ABC transporter solute-binding protein, Zn/Mn family [Cohnella panacarvi]|uniref:metal ABC transporter solute-binding protein, Zn/Mn family n=1 Tax=Cohnella panacarvi TaxID=400776 RepID=UPI000478B265|nr:zinc ABC transporter substrate-binding protein [Cohnella panacarvi]